MPALVVGNNAAAAVGTSSKRTSRLPSVAAHRGAGLQPDWLARVWQQLPRRRSVQPAAINLVSQCKRPLYDLYIKGVGGEVGDCPLSQRVMLHLEEKGLGYNKLLLDEQNKPDWIAEVCQGSKQIPIMHDLDTGKWLCDSDKMVSYLEEKFPYPELGVPGSTTDVGADLVPDRLTEFLTSEPGQETACKQRQLEAELRAMEDYLSVVDDGPFFGGHLINTHDLTMAPKLKHAILAGRDIKGWEMPGHFASVRTFMREMEARPSWQATCASDQHVRDGWQLKVKQLMQSYK